MRRQIRYLNKFQTSLYVLPQGMFTDRQVDIPCGKFLTAAIAADSDVDTCWARPHNATQWFQLGPGKPLPPPPRNQWWEGPLIIGNNNAKPILRGSIFALPTTVLGSVAVTADEWQRAFRADESSTPDIPEQQSLDRPWLSLEIFDQWPAHFPTRAPLVDDGERVLTNTEVLLKAWLLPARHLTRLTFQYGGTDFGNFRLVSLIGEASTLSGGWADSQLWPAAGYDMLTSAGPTNTTIVIENEPLHVLAVFGFRSGAGGSGGFSWTISSEER